MNAQLFGLLSEISVSTLHDRLLRSRYHLVSCVRYSFYVKGLKTGQVLFLTKRIVISGRFHGVAES